MEQLLITTITILFFPVACLLLLVVLLASIGKSLGLRRQYVQFLLKVFEFGRHKIEKAQQKQENPDDETEEEVDSDDEGKRVIRRDISVSLDGLKFHSARQDLVLEDKKDFHISDAMYFAKCGMEAVIEDDVTKCFAAEELKSWNFLTRTTQGHQFISVRLTILWCLGFLFRYCFLVPMRVVVLSIGLLWLIVSTAFIGYLPRSKFKGRLNEYVSLMSHRILARGCSAYVVYHNKENKASSGIVVANHTSPIDVIIMSCDNCYAMVGQAQGGFLGVIQRALSRATSHIWFERSEVKDRHIVAKRLRDHVADKSKLPILIFPEGTCINNTSVMMFKKGSFENSDRIHPVAIKYDLRFGDAFWNSSKMGMLGHLWELLTSWALVADVWYLPPMDKQEGEDAIGFASRVKKEIVKQGGFADLDWDGMLKRNKVKEEWISKPQEEYSKLIKVE